MRPVVCVTGASAGIGRAIALAFAAKWGASVALIARSAEALDEVRREVDRLGGHGLALPLDVADDKAVFEAADRIERELGPIDVWVNNAMVTVFGRAESLTPEELRRVTDVTYHGSVFGIQAALRHMKPRDHGTIIQIGSALAYRSIPLQGAYCGAKHAIMGFLDSVRSELIHDRSNVQLSMAQLPAVNTPQFDWARSHMQYRAQPMGKIFQPEDIGRAIVHIAENPKREYWLGGSGDGSHPRQFPGSPGRRHLSGPHRRGRAADGRRDPPNRPDNLFEPVEGRHRMRGRFGLPRHHLRLTSSGPTARLATVAAGSALAIGLGLLAGTALASRSR